MTAKLRTAGDQLPGLLYAHTFGNSEVHAPLQLVDLVCSAVLWPIAAWRFRDRLAGSPHISPTADACIRRRYRRRLADLMPMSIASAQLGEVARAGYMAVALEEVI